MKEIMFKLKNRKLWRHYKDRVIKKKPIIDTKKGAGYYLTLGLLFVNNKDKVEEWKMESGKVGLWRLLEYRAFSDPDDMVKWSTWQFLGYKGEKLLTDMSFREFVEFKKKQNENR